MSWQRIVENFHRLKTRKGRRTQQQFTMEGHRLFERALESGIAIRHALVCERLASSPSAREEAILAQLQQQQYPITLVPPEVMERLVEGRTFGSLLGFVDTLPAADIDALQQKYPDTLRLLVLVGIMDPGNIGALSRTAMASDVHALLAVGGTDLFHPKAVRTSMGALFDLPVLQVEEPTWLLSQCAQTNIQTIGAVVGTGQPPYAEQPTVSPSWALFVGSEAHGLPADLQQQLNLLWTIPMPDVIDSFSINAATAISLYELNRRRWSGRI